MLSRLAQEAVGRVPCRFSQFNQIRLWCFYVLYHFYSNFASDMTDRPTGLVKMAFVSPNIVFVISLCLKQSVVSFLLPLIQDEPHSC